MKKPRNAESRKSFIVTESGIVETDEEPITAMKSAKPKRDLQSLLSKAPNTENDSRPNTGSGEDRQAQTKPKPLKFNLDDVKSKLMNNKNTAEDEEKKMREKIQNLGRGRGDSDDMKTGFSGKKKDAIMTQFLVSKAVVLMSTERRKRRENAPSGNIGSLLAMSKFKSRVEKRRQSQSVVADNNGVVNSQVLIGLGKFKKSVLKKRVSVDEKPPEPTDQKMR